MSAPKRESGSAKPHLTHVALRSANVERSIDFYRRYAGLHAVHDRVDGGMRVVWLSEDETDPSFVFVLIGLAQTEQREPSLEEHFGFGVPSRAAVDEIAARGGREGILVRGPIDAGPIVGYFCMVRDPDGNLVEFSHGQPINPKQVGRT
jgi:catechol 2,3-dioxygenase-like lactoylglutathione lyase family enzyme